MSQVVIDVQPGYQNDVLRSEADIVIGGGAAGVGKTFSLLLDYYLTCQNTKNWGGVIFRRTYPQIKMEGGLWDSANELYGKLGFTARENDLTFTYFNGNKFQMRHLQHEKNVFDYQGSEIPWIGFDELTHFSRKMFFYLLTRNRGMVDQKPRIRATCNPDPDSWVADFISWWIDQQTGYPIPERAGKLRYFILDDKNYIWGDSVEEVIKKASHILDPLVSASGIEPKEFVKSVTFIPGSIYDNRKLLDKNPAYLSNLLNQDDETKSQLLEGNWKVKINENELIDYHALKDSFTNQYVQGGEKYIISDVAMKGSDKFIVAYFEGWRWLDVEIIPKSHGKMVIDVIKGVQQQYGVSNRNVTYDSDGVGSFVGGDGGFIDGAYAFHNGAKPYPVTKNGVIQYTRDAKGNRKPEEENYQNLKTQCAYKLGDHVNDNLLFIHERVLNKMYDEKSTVKDRLLMERKAIKRDKPDHDGKLKLLPKDQMKLLLDGTSPDLMDVLIMRKSVDIRPRKNYNYYSVIA